MNLELLHVLESALVKEGLINSASSAKCDNRLNLCQIDTCDRHAYAKGLCNAHYIRQRKGLDMDAPVRGRKRNDLCIDCGKVTDSKGGWNRCKSCYRKRRIRILKNTTINYFGGKCSICGISYDSVVYDFHHIDGKKEFGIADSFYNRAIEVLVEELSKCVLVCSNCHRLIHKEIRNGKFRDSLQNNVRS